MTFNQKNHDLREGLEKRASSLKSLRRPWENGMREVSNYGQRWQSRYMVGLGGGGRQTGETMQGGQANKRLFNSKAVRALGVLKNGMASGMSSPSQRWFKLKAARGDLGEVQAVKEWIDDTTDRLYAFLAGTSIYTTMQSGYGELGLFGIEAGLMTPDWEVGAGTYSLTYGEYWIGQNRVLRSDRLLRDATMTVAMVYDTFRDESQFSPELKRLKTAGKLEAPVPIMHMIEPNDTRIFGKIDKANKAQRSVYWETGSDKGHGILSLGGFDQKPFWAPRWDVQGMETYAVGPGFDILPESRKLQLQELRKQGAIDFVVRPPLRMNIQDRNQQANLVPSGITFTAAADMAMGAAPIWQVDHQAIPALAQDIALTEQAIMEGSYANLFMAITSMNGVQPRNVEEIARRHEEQLSQLGPVVDRVQVEKLSVIVLQAFSIMSNARLLLPVPDELNGEPLNIEFTSILSQAQQMLGLGVVERGLAFVGNMAGLFPQVIDIVDADDMARNYFDRLGVPAKTLFSPEEVDAARQQRAQEAQAEKMAAMAPAVKDLAAGAELLSRTDVGGRSVLDALSPVQPGV